MYLRAGLGTGVYPTQVVDLSIINTQSLPQFIPAVQKIGLASPSRFKTLLTPDYAYSLRPPRLKSLQIESTFAST